MAKPQNEILARRGWRALKVIGFVAATWLLAYPQLPLVWRALSRLGDLNVVAVIAGTALAFAALLAYAQLTRTLLDDGHRPGLWHSLGIATASLGVNRVLPAGAAASSVMTFRLLERAGVRRQRAVFAMTIQSIGSAIILNLLLWIGLLAILPLQGFASTYLIAIGVGAGVLAGVGFMVEALVRRRAWLWRTVETLARPIPRLKPASVTDFLEDQSARLTQLAARPGTMWRAVAWAVANWLLDAAALWVFLTAFDVHLNPIAVLVAFALANVVTFLPITPGGLGVVELTMTAALTGFGAAAVPAALGVAAYRVLNYWAPIPASAIAYFFIRRIYVAPDSVAGLEPAVMAGEPVVMAAGTTVT